MTPLIFGLGHFVNQTFDHILHLHPVWLLAAVALLVFAEDAIFVGFVIPGETAAVIAGVAASQGHLALWIAIVVVVLGAIAGDSVGYEVGKKLLPRVINGKLLAKHQVRIGRAQELLRRRGGIAVFLGRFWSFLRAMMPALAGFSHLPYRTFLVWNAAGGVVWGTGFVVLGYLAGSSYDRIAGYAGKGAAGALVAVAAVALLVHRIRSGRAEKALEASAAEKCTSPDA